MDVVAQKRISYILLSGTFLLVVGTFALLRSPVAVTPLLIVELALAVFRLGRMVSYDKVAETYRLPFVKTIPDPTGAGDTTSPRGEGWREALGDLVCCPICVGTWIAALLIIGLSVLPTITSVFVIIFAVMGVAELLNGAMEFLQWNGQLAREQAGTLSMAKRQALSEVEDTLPSYLPPAPYFPERMWRTPAIIGGNGSDHNEPTTARKPTVGQRSRER